MNNDPVVTQSDGKLRDELSSQLAAARRSLLRHIWGICVAFLVAMGLLAIAAILLIPPGTLQSLQKGIVPQGAGEGDFLKLFIPILAVAFGFVVGFLGLKRLEQFDSEITDVRNSLAGQVLEERRLSSAEREGFRKELEERIKEIRQSIQTLAERYAAEALESRTKGLEDRISRFTAEAENTISKIETRLDPYKWLQERKEELDNLVGVFTMGVAHERVTEFFSEKKVDLAVRVAKHAIAEKLSGTPDAYHNLAAELAKHDQEPLAVQVIDLGLSRFPSDVDLLSDGVKYSSSIGDIARAENLYQRLSNVDYSRWNWRAFVFAGDYLEIVGKGEEALALYDRFRQQIPDDERGYSQPGLFLRKIGKHNEAIKILEAGVAACRKCGQTAFSLSEIYLQRGDYERAMLMTDRASESTADEQPLVNQAAIIWNRAIAQDALIHKVLGGQKGEAPKEKILQLARGAVADYRTSVKMLDTLPVFIFRRKEREAILRNLLTKIGVDEDELRGIFSEDDSDGVPLGLLRAIAGDSDPRANKGENEEDN